MLHLMTLLASSPAIATAAEDVEAIWSIEVQRLPAASLESFLDATDPEVRARAALALGRLRDAEAAPLLLKLLKDDAVLVRHHAAFGLGLTPDAAQLAVDALATEKAPTVRAMLLSALGQHARPEDLSICVEALKDSAVESREASVALGRMALKKTEGISDSGVFTALAGQLRRVDPDARRAAAFAMARIAPETLPENTRLNLIRQARLHHDPNVRSLLVRALSGASTADPDSLLGPAIADPDQGVRIAAARALGKIGTASQLPALKTLLADRRAAVRLEAVSAAGTIEGIPHSELLAPFLKGAPHERAIAVRSLAVAKALGDSSRAYLNDKDVLVRAAAISMLDDKDQLVRLARRGDAPGVRTAAVGRLMELEPTRAHALALLESKDDVIAAVGLSILAESPTRDDVALVIALLGQTDNIDAWAEGMALLAVALPLVSDPEPARPIVVEGLSHSSPHIRAKAEATLSLFDDPPSPPIHMGPLLPSLSEVQDILSARIITDAGEMIVQFDTELAPLTVWNWASLAEQDYFDNLQFHRVVADFVIQDGCPRGDGWGGPGHSIPDELSWLQYDEGALGMALSGPDTGGSQWFITLAPQPHLDAGYTVFGSLVSGKGVAAQVHVGTVIKDVIIERRSEVTKLSSPGAG